ncbi:hypothetical protein BGX38DRAFT_1325584 [Terfezia claveryi]|nr:hypothetical protein BGX38DRAFT_1325584 [Terfezia claveryi]
MDMPSFLRKLITWSKGQADTALPPVSTGGKRIKSPDCSLGPADQALPTLVLETGYSESGSNLHNDAKTWLVRSIRDGVAELEDHAAQCVILLKVSKRLGAYCQKFRHINSDQKHQTQGKRATHFQMETQLLLKFGAILAIQQRGH